MPRRRKPKAPCARCGAEIPKFGKKYCSLQCGERQHQKWKAERIAAKKTSARAVPRLCASSTCGNSLIGNLQKIYCSKKCKQDVLHKRPTIEYERALRAKRTAKNIEVSDQCSVCKNHTARSAYVRPKANPLLPPEYKLCSSHAKGYASFISWNSYYDHDPDEVFAAYLVRLTFVSTTRQPFMVMMRKSFNSAY